MAASATTVQKSSDPSMSDHHLLSWSCPKCQRRSWLHYDHCMACGEARPKPVETEPSHKPVTEADAG